MHYRRRKKTTNTIAEINITPFVDVLLVILIIFMVTAPLMTTGFEVQLPKSNKSLKTGLNNKTLVLSLDKKSNIYLDNELVNNGLLIKKLSSYKRNTHILIKADRELKYKEVISLMNSLNTMGFVSITLVTEAE